MTMRKPSLGERGFTLIEVMISTGLVSLVLGSLIILLTDYSVLFREAQEKNALMTLRRRIIQNLNRRESWIVTYRDSQRNSSFDCFLDRDKTVLDCPGGGVGRNHFTLYGGRSFPPTTNSIVFSRNAPPTYTSPSHPNHGLTSTGAYCETFSVNSTAASARRCPIRLELTWELLTFGIPSPDPLSPQYYPTGYFPYGYYEGTGGSNYFGPGYFPGTTGTSDYWWLGTLAAQVRVRGTFTVNVTLKDKIKAANYDFSIIKEVP